MQPYAPALRTSSVQDYHHFEPQFFDRQHAEASAPPLQGADAAPARSYAPLRPLATDVAELRQTFVKLNLEFLESAEGRQARQEWTQALDTITGFAKAHGLTPAQRELSHLSQFRDASRGAEVDGEIELYRPGYKHSLEALARLLGNEDIPVRDRCEALKRLSGLDLCPERQASELQSQALWLEGRSGGLGNSVWSAYGAVAVTHLRELLRSEPALKDRDFTTPHALHPFAAALRLPGFSSADETTDTYVVDLRVHHEIVDRCAVALRERIGMATIAEHLADECLSAVREELAGVLGGRPLDLCQGPGHWSALDKTLKKLEPRFGDLDLHQVVALDADGEPEQLTDDLRLLTIGIRHNMTRQGIAPKPAECELGERVVDGERRRFMLFENRIPYVLVSKDGEDGEDGEDGSWLRLPTEREIKELLNPLDVRGLPTSGPSPEVRSALTRFVDSLAMKASASDPETVRALVAARPTAIGLEAVLERQGLSDQAKADWLRGAAPAWSDDMLDRALTHVVQGRGGASLVALLDVWPPGKDFAGSWQHLVRDQALRYRTGNTDMRIRGRQEGGAVDDGLAEVRSQQIFGQEAWRGKDPFAETEARSPQKQLLDRVEQQLGTRAPLAAARSSLHTFRRNRAAAEDDSAAIRTHLEEMLPALLALRASPARLLSVPVLAEEGGWSETLESTFFTGNDRRLREQFQLVQELASRLGLSPEETAALLQVKGEDRFPVPSPLVSALVLDGRHHLLSCVSESVAAMFLDGLLDASSAKRVLLPDAWEAEQMKTKVKPALVAQALSQHLQLLDEVQQLGILSPQDLAAAGESSALLRSAAHRGGADAVQSLEDWRMKYA